jgi:hypothetical protein
MVDTVKTLAALQTLLADNTAGDISEQDVRDFLVSVFPPQYVGASAFESGTQSCASGGWTSITMSSENFDTDAFHSTSTNTSRMTIPAGMGGLYLMGGNLGWAGITSTGRRGVRVLMNGTDSLYSQLLSPVATDSQYHNIAGVFVLAATDYVELQGYQNQGSNLATVADATFWIARLGQAPA